MIMTPFQKGVLLLGYRALFFALIVASVEMGFREYYPGAFIIGLGAFLVLYTMRSIRKIKPYLKG